jgi:hypothetical protein
MNPFTPQSYYQGPISSIVTEDRGRSQGQNFEGTTRYIPKVRNITQINSVKMKSGGSVLMVAAAQLLIGLCVLGVYEGERVITKCS